MNFYTRNGWAGSNYDSNLTTKEIAAKVRAYAKKNFPEFKFSVTSRWSTYSDSMYIVLKSGPVPAFLEGSKKESISTTFSCLDAFNDELTGKAFEAFYSVASYANSFRYSDSDAMEDYFDTNFYLNVELRKDEYNVTEPKAKKEFTKKQEKPETVETATSLEGLEIVEYSEKAIAVFGETKEIKDQLKELGGKFNPALKYNGGKRSGWIFSKKQADKVRALFAPSTKSDELYLECKEEFNEMIKNSLNDVCMIEESANDDECELTVNISVNGNKTNLYLYSWSGAHINDYMTGVYYYIEGLTYDEAFYLAEKFNAYRGKRVCSDGSDELRINFCSIDEAVLFEEWLKERTKTTTKEKEEPETLVIPDYEKYGFADYKSVCDEMDGFKLGEVVFDQCGEIGVILAFYDLGEVRLNSNGVCCIRNLKKCPKGIAEKELKSMDVLRPSVKDIKAESFPLEDIEFTQTDELNGLFYYEVEGADIITSAKVRADIQPGDVFNVYTDKERKYGVKYDGISPESSLYKVLPGIIETNSKLEAQTSIIPKELPANVEFYEKKVTGQRYNVDNKPDKFGYFHIVDNLDNSACDFYPNKKEAEHRAEYLNSLTNESGRIKRAI